MVDSSPTTVTSSPPPDKPAMPLQRRGQHATDASPATPVQPETTTTDRQRIDTAVERLWQELPYASLADDCCDRSVLVRCYTDSLNQLHTQHQAVERLFAAMCDINLEFQTIGPHHADRQRTALRATQRERLARGGFPPFLDDGTLTAQLAAQPPELIRLQLTESLRHLTTRLVRDVFAALDRFVAGEVVGLIEWCGEDTCLFHYFTESVTQQETGRRQKRGRKRERWIDDETIEVTQNVTHVTTGEDRHRRARHEHHLMDAHACAPGAETRPVPEPAWRLVQAIPGWLQPLVRIVEGDCIRERIIERELRSDTWRTEREDRVTYHIDPAIVLDRYVLTGWGAAAIQQETERQELLRQDRERLQRFDARTTRATLAGRKVWLAGLLTVFVQGLATAVTILSVLAPPLLLLATLLMLVGLWPLRAALRLHAVSRVRHADWRYLTIGSAAGLAALCGAQLVVLGAMLPWLVPLAAGVLVLGMAYLFGRQAVACYRRLPELPY